MPLTPTPQTILEQIEGNLRDAARVGDPLVRKILSAILERQAVYFRHLIALGRAPYMSKEDLASESPPPKS